MAGGGSKTGEGGTVLREKHEGRILIECPNTIFHLYINSERELSKIETFMNNIRSVKQMGLNDIYIWCNRQGIAYDTSFKYNKELSFWTNVKSYLFYSSQKIRYQYVPG